MKKSLHFSRDTKYVEGEERQSPMILSLTPAQAAHDAAAWESIAASTATVVNAADDAPLRDDPIEAPEVKATNAVSAMKTMKAMKAGTAKTAFKTAMKASKAMAAIKAKAAPMKAMKAMKAKAAAMFVV